MAYIRRKPWYWFETATVPAVSDSADTAQGVHDAFDRAIAGLFPGLSGGAAELKGGFQPRLDVTCDADAYTATVELPGVSPDAINLEVKDGNLIIQGEKKSEYTEEDAGKGYYRMERSYGSFRRVIALPDDACAERISAASKDGVLSIVIPRREKSEPASRKIEIAS